ncbi:MAG: MBL fold metallo-hydrolase [Paracoccaceae bacterium]
MTTTRRQFLATAAATGTITLLPFSASADGHAFSTPAGDVKIHPMSHASFIMETPEGVIYVDTVGSSESYADKPAPDLILITHRHGDHYNADTLALIGGSAPIITCPDVLGLMPDALKARTTTLSNGESTEWSGMAIDAIPAHNLSEAKQKFHPKGRDNGYVLGLEGFRVYISGDSEDVPEMRALKDIDLAFICMNLPFTMTAESAASAVAEFKPKFVYPYHYRGKDGGTQDPKAFAAMVGDAAEVKLVDWYPENPDL